MSASATILILYTELAGYTLASLEALRKAGNVSVHVMRWPVNNEAPFDFSFNDSIKVYDRTEFSTEQLLKLADEIHPDLILCSGWTDKGYLAVCKVWRKTIPVVLAMDNKWQGTAKQQLARLISKFTIQRYFSYSWVPGRQQLLYAEKLGFAKDKIKTGFYTCDVDHFAKIHEETSPDKSKKFPHVFVYAGRYYDFKGVEDMWDAFIRLKQESRCDWKMVCLGVGNVQPAVHPDISHEGFVQPDKLDDVMRRTGVFVLPSRVEPWGVVVQEFGAAGFPLLLSDAVGASDAFLHEGQNGFHFRSNDVDSLLMAMQSVVELPDEHLADMGKKSAEIACAINPQRWAQTLLSFIPHSVLS